MATRLNKAPAPTWNRLDINDISVQLPEPAGKGAVVGDAEITSLGAEIFGCIGEVREITASEETDIDLAEGGSSGLHIKADKGADITVISYITAGGSAVLRTFAEAGENAKIRLVQVIEGGEGSQILNDVGVKAADSAAVDVTQIFLGGAKTVSGVCAELNGYKSELACRLGYLVGENELLDINNIVLHKGKKSRSTTDVKGVLSGNAVKTFRGTIDFKNGAAGSVGAEAEDVLLMNESVVNKTVPVILCAEEDVEGSHGASIGRLAEDVLYYLTSRGIALEKAYELMAAARLEGLIGSIGSERAAARALEAVGRRWKNGAL